MGEVSGLPELALLCRGWWPRRDNGQSSPGYTCLGDQRKWKEQVSGKGPDPAPRACRKESVRCVAHQAWRESHREQRGERAWAPGPGQRARILRAAQQCLCAGPRAPDPCCGCSGPPGSLLETPGHHSDLGKPGCRLPWRAVGLDELSGEYRVGQERNPREQPRRGRRDGGTGPAPETQECGFLPAM